MHAGQMTRWKMMSAVTALVLLLRISALGALPADASARIVGAWSVEVGERLGDAIYQFQGDGKFTLTFEGPLGGHAGGTWQLRGDQLFMNNTWSENPFTRPGEVETATLLEVDDARLRLRTTDLKGKPEILTFQKLRPPPPLQKGKVDNPNLAGAYRSNINALPFVLAADGIAVFYVNGQLVIGQWAQRGQKLTLRTSEARPWDQFGRGQFLSLSYPTPGNIGGGRSYPATRPAGRGGYSTTRPTGAATRPARAGAASVSAANRTTSGSVIIYQLPPPAAPTPGHQAQAQAGLRPANATTRPSRPTARPYSTTRPTAGAGLVLPRPNSAQAVDFILDIITATNTRLSLRFIEEDGAIRVLEFHRVQ